MPKKKTALTIEERLQQALVPAEEQPYEVPENWVWVRLGGVTQVIGGGTPSTSKKEYYDGGTISWLSPVDLSNYNDIYISHGNKMITLEGLNNSSAKLLPKDTVCLTSRAPIGYVAIAENELSTNQGFKSFLPSPTYLARFLYWYLKGNKELLESKASGTTFLELSASKAATIEFPLPPLTEQQRIVERIEELFAKLDEAKERLQEVADSFAVRKVAILHKAFTGELTQQWRCENGVSDESWEEKTIGDIAQVKGGKRIPKGMSLCFENTGHPYIKAGNLKNGTVIDESMMYVSDEVLKYIKNYTVSAGDVYITNVGACIGDCGIIPEKYDGANLTENAVKLTDINCNNKFLHLFLASEQTQSSIKESIASATLGKLSIANIKKIIVFLPTLPEQHEIVRLIDDLLARERAAQQVAEQALASIDLMKKSILARAFRGELGTNKASEASALELLKQVLAEN